MYGHGLMTSDRKLVESKTARKMRWSAMILLPVAACLWLGSGVLRTARSEGTSVPNEIRATKFVVVDDTGKMRAEFGIMEDHEAGMVIWNEKKTAAVAVSVDHSGMPNIVFQNSKREALLELAMLDDKYPAFIMRDADGKRRLGMVVTESGLVTLRLYDTKKKDRCAISLGPDGDPRIVLRDKRGNVRASLILDEKGTSALVLFNRKDQERIVFQVDAQGQADAAVFGLDGKTIWSASNP